MTIVVKLDASRNLVTGEATVSYRAETGGFVDEVRLRGGLVHERFLKTEYRVLDRGSIQLGSMLLEMSGDGRELVGPYVGYGAHSQRLVHGTVRIRRVGRH